MSYQNYTDEELIEMFRAGDTDVDEYLLEKYKPLVRKKTKDLFLAGGEIEDLVQEGMIGLFKAMRDFNPEKNASFFSFAELCISRQIYTALEASNREKNMPLNDYVPFSTPDDSAGVDIETLFSEKDASPEQVLLEKEGNKEFIQSLQENLSELENKVLILYLNGKTRTEIANKLKISIRSVDNAIARVRDKAGLAKKKYKVGKLF